MKGPELVELLQKLGFEDVKTSQSSLDEAQEMMVMARLQASGLQGKPAAEEPAAVPGLPKKKKLGAPAAEEPAPLPVEPQATAVEMEPELKEPAKKQLPKAPLRKLPAKKQLEEVVEATEPEPAPPAEPEPAPEPVLVEAPAAAAPPVIEVAPPEPEPVPAPQPVETAAEITAVVDVPAPVVPVTPAPVAPASDVKKLLIPKAKAQVVGRIELPQETIRDATRRSAPANDSALRRAALQKTTQRTASRTAQAPVQRRGPGGMRGPARDSTGRPGQRRARTNLPSTVDPNKVIEVESPVSIKALSEALGVKVTELIGTLTFKLGVAGKNINSFLSNDEVELVALELGRQISIVDHKEAEDEMIAQLVEDAQSETEIHRPPIVTFMGHVDHGKTSLMDALRNSDIAKKEAGGITQHIGAYKVTNQKGQSFVILDTPGHAAFTAMRARGAQVTDLVVLVVAGDDGVMPQTEEAINHAKAASVPVIVAITKCDLPRANTMQVKQQLMVKGLQPEEWGGTTGVIEVSSVTRKGLDDLVDRICLDAEILDLKARPDAPGKGIVVESKQTPDQGVAATVLITDGTLRVKDQVVCGESFSRVRGMIDDHGRQVTEAPPSTPITLLGLDRLPMPGDKLFAVEDAKKAREVVEERQRRMRELSLAERSAITLETLSAKLAEKDVQEIRIILKCDVMGSLEPLRKCIDDLKTAEVKVNLVHSALGGINETDVSLAEASGAVIVGFNTVADSSARQAADRAGVEIRYYDVIYELLDQLRNAMEGLLKPEEVESILGHAEVRALFRSSKFGLIAGCYVTDGTVKRNAKVRLTRDGKVVHTGKVGSLRREKDDAKEVRAGFECGMTLVDYQDLKVGDILEFSQVDLVRRTL
ncbi:MAG: translation initiation factor [Planctomycetota bacterium]